MSFLRWFAREGFRTLKYVFRGIFRSLLRYVPCTMHPPLFSHPLRVNGMAGVSLAPMPPGIALKTAAARYAPLRLHLADRAGLPPLSRPALWPPYREVTSCRPRKARRRRRRYRAATIFLAGMPGPQSRAKPALGRSPVPQETEVYGTDSERNIPPNISQNKLRKHAFAQTTLKTTISRSIRRRSAPSPAALACRRWDTAFRAAGRRS